MPVHGNSCRCVNAVDVSLSNKVSHATIESLVGMVCPQTRPRGPADGWVPPPLRIGVRLPTPVDAPSARALADLHGRLFVRVGRVGPRV
jgi:hypothetical protein